MSRESGVESRESRVKSQESGVKSRETGTLLNIIMSRIAIFASGAGSNAQKIIDHFRGSEEIAVSLVLCNKPEAGVLQIAEKEGIPSLIIEKEKFFRGDA